MRDLCDAWKKTGRVDKLATQAMSFAEVKELLDVEEFLKPGKALRASVGRGQREGKRRVINCPLSALRSSGNDSLENGRFGIFPSRLLFGPPGAGTPTGGQGSPQGG